MTYPIVGAATGSSQMADDHVAIVFRDSAALQSGTALSCDLFASLAHTAPAHESGSSDLGMSEPGQTLLSARSGTSVLQLFT